VLYCSLQASVQIQFALRVVSLQLLTSWFSMRTRAKKHIDMKKVSCTAETGWRRISCSADEKRRRHWPMSLSCLDRRKCQSIARRRPDCRAASSHFLVRAPYRASRARGLQGGTWITPWDVRADLQCFSYRTCRSTNAHARRRVKRNRLQAWAEAHWLCGSAARGSGRAMWRSMRATLPN
jgi:hypothetical protein